MTWGIHWFRRDLRVAGNPALRWSWKQHQGKVLGIFCFDPTFLSRPDFSNDRFGFFLKTIEALRDEMRELGGDLLVLDRGPKDSFQALFEQLKSEGKPLPATVSFNRDYEPFARTRDAVMTEFLERLGGIEVHTERDHLLIEPHEIKKESDGHHYTVYSPYARRWFEKLAQEDVQARIQSQIEGLKYLKARAAGRVVDPLFHLKWSDLGTFDDSFEKFCAAVLPKVTVPLPQAGSLAAYRVLQEFKAKVSAYKDQRDLPAVAGTSRLSIYIKNGSITSAQVLAELGLQHQAVKSPSGETTFVKELAWREFYYQILWHVPRVENESYLRKYKDLAWENRQDFFEAWKEGRTGYPIVDAGMRELNATGWMHNRVRMIVASFLTKDLLIDWRWGEKYFMQKLLDGDLAPNNGGWQWAASTGCDPQPYFRIFNPKLQGERFDEEGEYIRKWIPELTTPGGNYPRPIVVHADQKPKALALYKASAAE